MCGKLAQVQQPYATPFTPKRTKLWVDPFILYSYEIWAKMLAQRFPQELAHLLPPKREAWMNENPKMAMFDAVAFAVILSTGGQTRPATGR
jgi:hypothetical protein